jgi:hypothetical protein
MQISGGPGGQTMRGTMYFGGSKIRMEMAMGGSNQIMIVDTVNKTQIMIMPDNKMYMEMPSGAAGMMKTPKVDVMDPANPCAGGGATQCKRIGAETVNGYATEKWEFKQDGETWTAWIATKLRIPIKMSSASGSGTEFRNIVEGTQPASLFQVPPGYQKMDMGGMGQ